MSHLTEESYAQSRHNTLREDYNPNWCIHCDSLSTSGVSIQVMTAESDFLGGSFGPGGITRYRYSHFFPLVLAVCENCLRTVGKEAKKDKLKPPGLWLGGMILILILVWNAGVFSPFSIFMELLIGIGFLWSVWQWHSKYRTINPELDPLSRVCLLLGNNDRMFADFESDVAKAVRASRGGLHTEYWSMSDFDRNIKPKLGL